MIFFAGVSTKAMIRVVFPYFLGFLAVVAVSAVYLYQTDRVYEDVIAEQEQRVLGIAENLETLSRDPELYGTIFTSQREMDIHYLHLRSEMLGCIELRDCVVARPADGANFHSIPFDGDSLAARALYEGIPILQRTGSATNLKLTVFYPVTDSTGSRGILRLEFKGMMGASWVNRYRYNFFVLASAVIMLIIIPGLILKLAELRRRIEINGYFEEEPLDTEFNESSASSLPADSYPSSLLSGSTSVALFRLNSENAILHINSEAESLIDIPASDALGLRFHELPCIQGSQREEVRYPEPGDELEFSLGFTDSVGNITPVLIRVENLGNSGYALSARRESMLSSSEMEDGGSVSTDTEVVSAELSPSEKSIQRAIYLAEEGRKLVQADTDAAGQFNMISRVLMGIRQRHPRMDLDQMRQIDLESELERISSALNDVLPERASVEVDILGDIPDVECSSKDLTQIVKNMVFYSLESVAGPVRVKVSVRDVPSPFSDSVFSSKCDRSVPRAVSLSYSDGTRIPVLLKEALLDPETDTSGIQRDFGTHISSVAAVLARLEAFPVFTEGSGGTSLNILFRISESSLFDVSGLEARLTFDMGSLSLAFCDSSREVRDSISDFLSIYGTEVVSLPDLEALEDQPEDLFLDYLILDVSILESSIESTLKTLRIRWPEIKFIFSFGSAENLDVKGFDRSMGIGVLKKPYSPAELIDVIELLEISSATGTGSN